MAFTHKSAIGLGNDPKDEIIVWFRSDQTENVQVEYSVNSDLSGSTLTATVAVAPGTNDGINTVSITGLTAGQLYYYRLIGSITGNSHTSGFPTFSPMPTSMVGKSIMAGSCTSVQSLSSVPGAKLFTHAKDVLNVLGVVHLGDLGYMEDNDSLGIWSFNDAVPADPPPVTHFESLLRDTYGIVAVGDFLESRWMFFTPSDHDRFSGHPDLTKVLGNYTHLGVDDPTTAQTYANATTAYGYYVGNFARCPNAGANWYGTFTIGNVVFVVMDTRTHRERQFGRAFGDPQKAWFRDIMDGLTVKQMAVVFMSDTFAGDDALNGDGLESDDSTLIIGYLADRDTIDAYARRAKGKVVFFGGDRHFASHAITKGGNHAFTCSPFDDAIQREGNAMTARVIYQEKWRSKQSNKDLLLPDFDTEDNRMMIITFGANNALTVTIYRANQGVIGIGAEEVTQDYQVTI